MSGFVPATLPEVEDHFDRVAMAMIVLLSGRKDRRLRVTEAQFRRATAKLGGKGAFLTATVDGKELVISVEPHDGTGVRDRVTYLDVSPR